MNKLLPAIVLVGCLIPGTPAAAQTSPPDQELSSQMDRAWEVTWDRFYLPRVQTFGDYLSSYDPGREQAHLPTAEEVKRQYPNPCGYSTGRL